MYYLADPNCIGSPAVAHNVYQHRHHHNNVNYKDGMKNRVKFHDSCSVGQSIIEEDSSEASGNLYESDASGLNDCVSMVSCASALTINSFDPRSGYITSCGGKNESNWSETTKVFDLPWSDGQSNGVRGRYSGPVDDLIRPHGQGKIVLDGSSELQFVAFWKHGALVSPLRHQGNLNSVGKQVYNHSKIRTEQVKLSGFESMRNTDGSSNTSSNKSSSSSPQSSECSAESDPGLSTNKQNGHKKPALKYSLGDVARTPRDMVVFRSNKESILSAAMIGKFQQCFIRRSNGLWTVAILADRGMQPVHQRNHSSGGTSTNGSKYDPFHWYAPDELDDSMNLEPSMLFVINSSGHTKIIQKRHWGKYVRRLNDGGVRAPHVHKNRSDTIKEVSEICRPDPPVLNEATLGTANFRQEFPEVAQSVLMA